ncbi:universal stress protein [Aurantivibrio infirmus]
MYKTILCAIEASKEGRQVLGKAAELAKACNAKLVVIHVIAYTLLPKDYQKALTDEVSPKFNKIADSFSISKKNRVIKVGKPYDLVCREAKKRKADLIVLGTHSKKGIQSLVGSTANGVVNYAKCDVTLIRIA